MLRGEKKKKIHDTMYMYEYIKTGKKKKKFDDPDVIRTRNLLIWSQTRYRCATESSDG